MDAKTAGLVDVEIARLLSEAVRLGDERRKGWDGRNRLRTWAGRTLSLRNDFVSPALAAAGLMGSGAVLFWVLAKLLA